jgi:uncharacterized HAD superfamily protein
MQTIAIDIDDVLSSEVEAMRLFINERFGLSLKKEDYRIPGPYWGYWESVWGVANVQADEWYQAYLDENVKANHQLHDGANEAIAWLKQHYRLAVVTSREDSMIDTTHAWLEKHFPKTFDHVEFVRLWSEDRKVTKAEICQHIGATYLIDDSIEHCNLAYEAGIGALLFGDYGWHKEVQIADGIVRVRDWSQVKEYFRGKISGA